MPTNEAKNLFKIDLENFVKFLKNQNLNEKYTPVKGI